ncbi:hypothetical protein [uncultured Maribacter sp.]|uniref:hypothetical protein n=1 Tax=uncultured Maribacter sp. TaxID=431308 RepID=UPI0026312441|nr:hypothetical protein [uncultured Maribacter sp.]
MSQEFYEIFDLKELHLKLYLDKNSNLYYREDTNEIYPLKQMPWRLQAPFYFKFLHSQQLGDLFKDHDVIGGIDLFVKWKYCLQEDLNITSGLVAV